MGKDKSSQRTKGNVKPSSSGRSAELLGGVTSFVGFSGLDDLGYVPAATQATVDDDTQISAEFRIALRKMSKKDSITKMKALQEFEQLCSSEDIESLKIALPYWPRLYSKLTFDCNRLVRESAQSAHSALVSQIGKNLAPYLRSVMPSWLLAMTDPHSPVAITASKSFQSAFSEEKRPGVMIFCSKEIIDFISDNLFIQSAQTLSDPKNTVKEDQDSKYIRVLFCSLKGLSLFLETTTKLSDKKGEIVAKLIPFLEQENFWKLAKHENTLVRSAWFDTIKGFFEFDVEPLRNHIGKLSKNVFTTLDSPDAIVLPHIWIAFLHLCVGLPECWDHCGNPKSVFNRIFSVLRDGGRGFMMELSPQLLPILSVLPVRMMEDQTAFYIDFFRAISTSLRKDKVLACKRHVSAIIVALNECLKYMSKEHGSNKELWDTLLKYQVVDLLRGSFEDTPQLSATQLYQEVGKLLLFWSSATDSKRERLNLEKLDMFWDLFLPDCDSWLLEGNETKISKLRNFFIIIKDPFSSTAKRSKGVRFKEETQEDSVTTKAVLNAYAGHNVNHVKNISTRISCLVRKCLEAFVKNKGDHVFELFAIFLFLYSSDQTYQEMVDHKVDNVKARMLFLEGHILPFLEVGDKVAPLKTTIDLFLHVYTQMTEEQQRDLLMNLKPSLRIASLKLLIEKMTERIEHDSVAACWLKSPPLGGRMIKCVQQLCAITLTKDSLQSQVIEQQHQCLIELLSFIFSNGYKKRTVFSLEYQSQMLKFLKTILLQLESKETSSSEDNECTASFIVILTQFINHLLDSFIHSQVDGLEEILKQFYRMLCHPFKASTEAVMSEVKACFFKAFEQNLRENMSEKAEELFDNENSLLVYVLRETKALIISETCPFSKILELSDLIDNVLIIMFKASPSIEDCSILLDHSIMKPTLEMLFPTEYEWEQQESKLSPLYVTPAVLAGTFICREFSLPLKSKDIPPWHQSFVKASLFLVRVITTLCSIPPTTDDESPTDDLDEGSVSLGPFLPLMSFAIHGACHSSSMVQMNTYLNNNSVSSDVILGNSKLTEGLHKLLDTINTGNKKLIVKNLRDRCSHGNSCWCVTLERTLTTWIKVPVDASKLLKELNENFLGYTETKQILLPYLLESDILEILMEETEKLSRFSEDPFSALPSVCLITSVLEYLSRSTQEKKLLNPENVEAAIHAIFDVLVKWRDTASNIFLFASDLSGVPWEDASMMVSIIRLLTVIVKGHSVHLLHSHWDVTLCALSAWVQSLAEVSQFPEAMTVIAMFATVCSKCGGVVSELLSKLAHDAPRREHYPPTLVEEWQEFFAPSIFNTLLIKFIQCANVYEKERNIILFGLMRSLAVSVSCTEGAVLRELNLPPLFNVSDSESSTALPDTLHSLVNHLSSLMLSRHPHSQCASYCLLKESLPDVMAAWEKSPHNIDEEEDLPQKPLPEAFMSIIKEAGPVVETALIDKEMGCMCEVLPYTDAYTFTAGYLLGWYLVLTAITYGEEKNQQLYASYIRESNLLWTLLNNLFKLMPLKPTLEKEKKPAPKADATMFNTPVTVSAGGKVSSEFISWMACQVYISCLTQLPAAVRNWWTNLERNNQQIVDKFTTTYVSPILISNEISTMNESTIKFDNMTIKTRPGAREIIAVYTIDEASMELVLRMAANHPLSTVNLEDHKRVGVSIAQWRNWLFGLNTMLSHRNTPLLNSLEFWKKNVDQKFEGIEECFICYYVLHGSNHQVPKLLCRTCKKKFHSACLYKWFSTSNNSTCPICRSLF